MCIRDSGEAKTDKDGKFTIEFEAIPDKTLDKKLDPIFEYTVYADVTDINGETRSSQTEVSVGYKALLLKVDLPLTCLLYTSDAADERSSVDLGGRRIIK